VPNNIDRRFDEKIGLVGSQATILRHKKGWFELSGSMQLFAIKMVGLNYSPIDISADI